MKDKTKDKASSVVKSKLSTELPKDKVDLHKYKSKPKVKNNVKLEVPILRSRSKCKPEVKAKAYVRVLKSNENFRRISKEKHDGGNVSNRDNDNDHLNIDDDLNDKEPMSSNPSFGFSKVNLDDFDKQLSSSGEEYGILSTPESYTQWLERNADLVGEMIDSITDEVTYLVTMEVRRLTPDKMATRASKVSLSPKKRIVKPSSYLLSPYMNKKTKVVPKITRLEFTIRNYLFAMQGDKMEKVFESNSGEFIVYGVSLDMETLAPARHFSNTGCITKSMFDRTLVCDDGKWESFSNQVKAQPKGKESGLALEGLIWHSRVARVKHNIP
nr:hypothetical protein [Tanacetum cinerariifolium]